MGFPTKSDHLGVFWGVPPFQETSVSPAKDPRLKTFSDTFEEAPSFCGGGDENPAGNGEMGQLLHRRPCLFLLFMKQLFLEVSEDSLHFNRAPAILVGQLTAHHRL